MIILRNIVSIEIDTKHLPEMVQPDGSTVIKLEHFGCENINQFLRKFAPVCEPDVSPETPEEKDDEQTWGIIRTDLEETHYWSGSTWSENRADALHAHPHDGKGGEYWALKILMQMREQYRDIRTNDTVEVVSL